ncbi:hypothetical protein [Paenibacillus sanfengchensis]|uniref:hypothetical protein n=1 Tax=Paenibacillus sanfengchensis TaxID=3119819 RepID=UPI002FE294CA
MLHTIRLEISKSQEILLYLPCEKQDVVFLTDVSLKYWRDGKMICDLFVHDFFIEAVKQLYNLLTKALNNELQLKSDFVEKGIGFYHNIYMHELWTTDNSDRSDPAEEFLLWSSHTEVSNETFIYNIEDKIYLEISPFYKWDSDYPDDETEYQTFEEYVLQYQMIDLIHIEQDTAKQWQKILHELLKITQTNESLYRKN